MIRESTHDKRGYSLERDVDIAGLTTFRVASRVRLLASLHDTQALPELLERPQIAGLPRRFVLGGGSNVLFRGDFDGLVLRIATRGIEVVDESPRGARLRVAAGENWDAFVRWTLEQGYAGLENLILIPGTAGAAPIQNIGAYGVELSEFVAAVEARDIERGKFVSIAAEDCRFAYRDSRFKRESGRFVVTALELELPRERELRLAYAGVREELESMDVDAPDHGDVARAVERLRLRKLPDPARIGNAGSFFKNPLVTEAKARAVQATHPELTGHWAGDGLVKLSAAQLVDACGFKGRRAGNAGVSDKHALVLVNRCHATGGEIWALAERIRVAVAERFDIELEPEPRLL